VSGWVESGVVVVPGAPIGSPVEVAPLVVADTLPLGMDLADPAVPASTERAAPARKVVARVLSRRLRGGVLRVSGTATEGARVTVAVRVTRGRRARTITRSTTARDGRWRVTMRVGRRAKAKVVSARAS
jgi:hypothetical protein